MDLRNYKSGYREYYKTIREKMDTEIKEQMDSKIRQNFFSLKEYGREKIIFTYLSKSLEVDTFGIVQKALSNKKKIAVPFCIPGTSYMEFYFITADSDMRISKLGIIEPNPQKCIKVKDFSKGICIVPGLSFTFDGYRLGYGKGYYDRFLDGFGGLKVGICYSNCMRQNLPTGRYDCTVDIIVTDKCVGRIKKEKVFI